MAAEHTWVTTALAAYWTPLLSMHQITLAGGGIGDPYLMGSDARELPDAGQLYYQHIAANAGEGHTLGSDRVVRVETIIDGWLRVSPAVDAEGVWVGQFGGGTGKFYDFDQMMDPWSWLDESQANTTNGFARGFAAEPRYTIEGGWERTGNVFHAQMTFVIFIIDSGGV